MVASFLFVFQNDRGVSYSSQHYDRAHSLVSFRFSPRPHSPPAIFFSRFANPLAAEVAHFGMMPGLGGGVAGGGGGGGQVFDVVHDFASGLQYTIEQRYTLLYFSVLALYMKWCPVLYLVEDYGRWVLQYNSEIGKYTYWVVNTTVPL